MTVEDFYQRIKRDHEDTWQLIKEINKTKLVKNPERINHNMIYRKHDIIEAESSQDI